MSNEMFLLSPQNLIEKTNNRGLVFEKNIVMQVNEMISNDYISIYDYINNEIDKKYNRRTLFRMKQFYNLFSNEKVSTMWTQLTWSHIRLLFNLDYDSINYYIQVVTNNHISVRELEYKLKSNEFERLPLATRYKLTKEEIVELKDIVPNPIFIKNNYKYKINYVLKQMLCFV